MQNSLFDEVSIKSSETVDEINQETLEKGKLLFPDKFFIFGTGKIDADVVIVGESPTVCRGLWAMRGVAWFLQCTHSQHTGGTPC